MLGSGLYSPFAEKFLSAEKKELSKKKIRKLEKWAQIVKAYKEHTHDVEGILLPSGYGKSSARGGLFSEGAAGLPLLCLKIKVNLLLAEASLS